MDIFHRCFMQYVSNILQVVGHCVNYRYDVAGVKKSQRDATSIMHLSVLSTYVLWFLDISLYHSRFSFVQERG